MRVYLLSRCFLSFRSVSRKLSRGENRKGKSQNLATVSPDTSPGPHDCRSGALPLSYSFARIFHQFTFYVRKHLTCYVWICFVCQFGRGDWNRPFLSTFITHSQRRNLNAFSSRRIDWFSDAKNNLKTDLNSSWNLLRIDFGAF